MSEIPQDVIDAAIRASCVLAANYDAHVLRIAEAIMAERERCFEIAYAASKDWRLGQDGKRGAAIVGYQIRNGNDTSAGLSPSQAPATGKADTGLPVNSPKE